MSHKKAGILCGAILAFALVAMAPMARADDVDQASQFTFEESVTLPGNVVLPPGTYWFALADPEDSFDVARVFDADRTKIVATFLRTSTTRATPTDNSQLTLAVQSRKEPAALLNWYYGGRFWGHEFHYSPQMEEKLRKERQVTLGSNGE